MVYGSTSQTLSFSQVKVITTLLCPCSRMRVRSYSDESRMVNLTTLVPDIVEAILEDALPDHLTLFDIAVDPPALWEEQRSILTAAKRSKS